MFPLPISPDQTDQPRKRGRPRKDASSAIGLASPSEKKPTATQAAKTEIVSTPKPEFQPPDLSEVREAYAGSLETEKPKSRGGRNYVSKRKQEELRQAEVEKMQRGFRVGARMVANVLAHFSYPDEKPTEEEIDLLNETGTAMIEKHAGRMMEYSVEISFGFALFNIIGSRLWLRWQDRKEQQLVATTKSSFDYRPDGQRKDDTGKEDHGPGDAESNSRPEP